MSATSDATCTCLKTVCDFLTRITFGRSLYNCQTMWSATWGIIDAIPFAPFLANCALCNFYC